MQTLNGKDRKLKTSLTMFRPLQRFSNLNKFKIKRLK